MSKFFRPWKIDEVQLLPASVQDYVPSDHLSRFILALVRENLDLSELIGSYRSELGQPPFDPRMMTALLLTGYASGIYSSRRIAKACKERADFMMIVAGDDGEAQIIVAQGLTPSMSDQHQLVPLVDAIQADLGRKPREASADSGYLSEANLEALGERDINAYIAIGRAKHPTEPKREIGGPLTKAMRTKLKRARWRSRYRLRKQIVEPVFGQIKEARGFRQFLLRGIEKVRAEWALICIAHNLTKLARAA